MSPQAPRVSTPTLLLAALALTGGCNGIYTADDSGFPEIETTTGAPHDATAPAPTTTTLTGTTADPDTTASTAGDDATTTGDATTTTGDATTTGDPGGLCDHLGGMADVPALIADLLARVLADDRVNGYFLNSDVDPGALAGCLADQLGAAAGCPGVTYSCQDMVTAHQGLGISAVDFTDFLEHIADALAAHKTGHPDLTDVDIAGLTAALAALAPEIVEDPTDDLTIYQRLGRKPGIRALVGDETDNDSFLGLVADDVLINGFFLGADFDRLATCMTRQLAAIDGPVVYGAEVDAPDVEPGVSADDPCKEMAPAHAGAVDDLLSQITIDDFGALLIDLTVAMNEAGVVDDDHDAVLAAFIPLCDQIVADVDDCPGYSNTVDIAATGGLPLDLVPVDGDYDGSLATMRCVDVDVPSDGLDFVEDVRLTVAMDHTWIGDVTIKLIAPDGKLLTVLSRPGDPDGVLPDSSADCCGDDSNFKNTAPFTFRDGAAHSAKDMGVGPMMTNNMIVCVDELPVIDPCEWSPFPGLGPGTKFADFAGISAVGTWQVCFGDSGTPDFGAVSAVTLHLDKQKNAP
jgi:truncated hemoglobin YjbI